MLYSPQKSSTFSRLLFAQPLPSILLQSLLVFLAESVEERPPDFVLVLQQLQLVCLSVSRLPLLLLLLLNVSSLQLVLDMAFIAMEKPTIVSSTFS